MSNVKFYICEHCGNMIKMVKDSGIPVVCCGEPMKELVANTTEASAEKHIPEVKVEGNVIHVQVGSDEHPMVPGHFIQWICLETEKGIQMTHLSSANAPKAIFVVEDDRPSAVYEYCNLHGLWKKQL